MNRYQHDHDEELGAYWFGAPPPNAGGITASPIDALPAMLPDPVYWMETGNLVREYLALQAGPDYSDTLRQGFVTWLKGSRAERQRYVDGDDMQRAALVDWYLKVVR
jgi:hypothetical protein